MSLPEAVFGTFEDCFQTAGDTQDMVTSNWWAAQFDDMNHG